MFGRDPLANPEPLIRRVHSYVAYCIGDGPELARHHNELGEPGTIEVGG